MNMFMLFILALLPIIWLIVAMSVLKMPGWKACVIALVVTFVIALGVKHMSVLDASTAALEGICNALWPIIIVILAALFTYNLTVKTGAMEQIKSMLAAVSPDKRILMLLIAFGFGNFMEGMAGFGTAVAIPAGILVGLGFEPLTAVVLCLVINSTPTAFGSVGVPTITMSNITGLNVIGISSKVALIQLIIQFIIPFVAICIMCKGPKGLKGIFPFVLIADLAYLIPQYFVGCFMGPDLANIIGAIIAMGVIVLLALKLKLDVPEEYKVDHTHVKHLNLTVKSALVAWSPFILIFVFLLCTSTLVPFIHDPLSSINTSVKFYTGKNPGTLTFYWINTPGVLIFLAGFIGGKIQGAKFKGEWKVLLKTDESNVKTIVTICSVLAVAKIMGYSGMTSDISKVLVAVTGTYFPLISPLIGMIGGFVTGSGTSTTALFGAVQVQTAKAIGASQYWLAAANLCGAGLGKMICPQSIAIGCAAVGLGGKESEIMGKAVPWSLIFTVIAGIVCFLFPILGLV